MPSRMRRTAALAVPLALALAGNALAQSSTNFRLVPGVPGAGGSATSTSFRVAGAAAPSRERASGATRDLAVGFVAGAFNTQQATVSITTTGGQYSSIGFPVEVANHAPTAVLDELGAPNNTAWRFAHWSPVDSAYMEVGTSLDLTTVTDNLGYWLVTAGNSTVQATGRVANPLAETVPLQSGPSGRPAYNQLANPFLFPILVLNLLVVQGPTTIALTNGGNTFTEQVVKVANGSGSCTNLGALDVINGRTAFWVKKLAAGSVDLVILPLASSTGSPVPPAITKPEGADWAVAVNAVQGWRAAEPLMVGAAPVAADAWNPLCISRTPEPPGGALSLHVAKSEWGRMNGDYVREFRPAAESMSWDFTLSSPESPGEATLEFATLDLPAGARLSLSDPSAGWTREVSNGQRLNVLATSAPRTLRLTASLAGGGPATVVPADGFRGAMPNPFGGRVALTFTLARGGDLEAGVFDVLGRQVRSFRRDGLGPGDHVLQWDGRNADGHGVPAGVYLVRYRVGDVSGATRVVRIE